MDEMKVGEMKVDEIVQCTHLGSGRVGSLTRRRQIATFECSLPTSCPAAGCVPCI